MAEIGMGRVRRALLAVAKRLKQAVGRVSLEEMRLHSVEVAQSDRGDISKPRFKPLPNAPTLLEPVRSPPQPPFAVGCRSADGWTLV